MKVKTIVASFVAGASLLTMVGAASAAMTSDINIYGASAQYNYWKGQAVNFMGAQGCNTIQSAVSTDGKHWITRGNCGGTTRYFRSSSKASYDGPLAVQGNTTNPNRTTACSNPYQRKMMDEALVTSWGTGTNAAVVADTAASKCTTVTGGTSDVEVTSFRQESHGMLMGPSTSTKNVWVDRNFTGTGAVKSTGLTNCRPLVVPFGAFATNNVTKNNNPIDNITTAELRLIFSGQIFNWGDLAGYDAKEIRVCWRHAGSGTAATFDWTVMNPAALALYEDAIPGSGYEFWFNDAGQDVLNCLSGAQAAGFAAIGYADADATKPTGVNALKHNGVLASKDNLKNGSYDWYTVQNLYTATPRSSLMTNLCNFMQNPANNNNAWYPVACEMKYIRMTDDGSPVINSDYCGL